LEASAGGDSSCENVRDVGNDAKVEEGVMYQASDYRKA
jgi:hypothetical protein